MHAPNPNTLRARRKLAAKGWRFRKPSWTTYYRMGVELNKRLHPIRTFDEIALILGVTKQNAYTEAVLALGKSPSTSKPSPIRKHSLTHNS